MTVSTRQASSNTKPATRSMYALTLQAAPGQDGIRSLRALLKTAGRYYGLRAVSIRALPSSLRNRKRKFWALNMPAIGPPNAQPLRIPCGPGSSRYFSTTPTKGNSR